MTMLHLLLSQDLKVFTSGRCILKLFKKIFKRHRKSRSTNFKMVGVYKEDHISLKVLAREENKSISARISAMIHRWVGMKY